MPQNFLVYDFHAPDFARRKISVYVRALQIGKLRAVINHAAGQRARFAMMMLDRRHRNRIRPDFAVRMKEVAALVAAPTVVRALFDEVRLLPQILAVLPDPKLSRLFVERHAPRIAETIGPRFRPSPFAPHERIVR